MEILYSRQANAAKKRILDKYKYAETDKWFTQLEEIIRQTPYDARAEEVLSANGFIKAYKRNLKTNIFSGRLRELYLYLSVSYTIDELQQVEIIGVYDKQT